MFLYKGILCLLFLLRIFNVPEDFVNHVESTYGKEGLKKLRKYEDISRKFEKAQLDNVFLVKCKTFNVMPKFLRFKLYKKSLQNTKFYKAWQSKLLNKEINDKKKKIVQLEREKESLIASFGLFSFLDRLRIRNYVRSKNEAFIARTKSTHEKKLSNLGINIELAPCNPDDVIHNYSSFTLPDRLRFLLAFGLDFCLPVTKLDYFKYFSAFETLSVKLKHLDDSVNFTSGLKDIAYKYFHGFKSSKVFSAIFSLKDINLLKQFSKMKDIIVVKPDKGRGVVILDRIPYLNKMCELISDPYKFRPLTDVSIEEFTRKAEDKINRFLAKLKSLKIISEEKYRDLYASGTGPGILYGLPKIHKPDFATNFKFRPIFAAYNTPSFNIAKYLVPILSPLTKNEYTVENSTQFVDEITKIPSADKYYMASFDVVSLFTNIPLEETIEICVNKLFSESTTFMNFTRKLFTELLSLAVKSTFFVFDNRYYEQIEGLGMGLPLGPSFANIFMCFHEKEWLNDCPEEFKPVFYRRYVDDTFMLFKDKSHVSPFFDYLNSKHPNIKYGPKPDEECEGVLNFLDINVKRNGNDFETSVYRKPTFTGLGSSFFSYCPLQFKLTAISTLVTRAYRICSNYKDIHLEFSFLRNFFKANGYPAHLVDRCIKKFLERRHLGEQSSEITSSNSEKKDCYLSLPYFGYQSEKMKCDLVKFLSKLYKDVNFKIVLSNKQRIGSFFNHKDRVSKSMKSSIVYKYTCCVPGCTSVYIGSTKRHLYERVAEHVGVSSRTGAKLSSPNFSAIREHSKLCKKCKIDIQNFNIIGSCNSESGLRILESLHINKMRPKLNNMSSCFPLSII